MSFKVTKKVSDVATDVKRTFGDEASVQVSDPDIIRWVNQAQNEIVSKNQVLVADATTPSIVNTYEYDVSSLNIQSIHSVHYSGVKLKSVSFQDFEETYLAEDPLRKNGGFPEVWTRWGNDLTLYPTPNASGDPIKIYYYGLPTTVTTLDDLLSVPDNYYNRVLEFVLAQAYELDENYAASDNKLNRFDSNLVGMNNDEQKPAQDFYPTISARPEDL